MSALALSRNIQPTPPLPLGTFRATSHNKAKDPAVGRAITPMEEHRIRYPTNAKTPQGRSLTPPIYQAHAPKQSDPILSNCSCHTK